VTTEEERVRARIAQELRVAMKARDAARAAALRSFAAALDNATAVPMPSRIPPNENVEVPRKVLSLRDVRAVLMREIAERRDAAVTLKAHSCFEEAAAVEAEIEVLEQYIDRSCVKTITYIRLLTPFPGICFPRMLPRGASRASSATRSGESSCLHGAARLRRL